MEDHKLSGLQTFLRTQLCRTRLEARCCPAGPGHAGAGGHGGGPQAVVVPQRASYKNAAGGHQSAPADGLPGHRLHGETQFEPWTPQTLIKTPLEVIRALKPTEYLDMPSTVRKGLFDV